MASSSAASAAESRRSEGTEAGVCLFSSEGHRFAVETSAVGEVTTTTTILPVPMVPTPVVGLFNLRGSPLVVVDLLSLLDLRTAPAPSGREGTTLLVVRTDHPIAALRVDRLEKVLPNDVGRRVVLDVPGVSPAQIGLFEPPDAQPAIPLLGARPLVKALLALAFGEAQNGSAPARQGLQRAAPRDS